MSKIRTKLILAVIFLVLFGIIAALVLSGILGGVESWVYEKLSRLIRKTVTGFFTVFTNAASFGFIVAVLAALLVIPYTRRKYGFPAALTAGISALVNILLKLAFSRERPDILRLVEETGQSFPSGHTQSGTAFYLGLALLVYKNIKNLKLRIPLLALTAVIPFIVGLSRIYLGVHYFGDVLGGWTLGTAIALSVNILWEILRRAALKGNKKVHGFFFEEQAAKQETS